MFSPNMRSVFFFIIITFFFTEQSYILSQKRTHERHTDAHTPEVSTSTRTTLRWNDLRIDTAVCKSLFPSRRTGSLLLCLRCGLTTIILYLCLCLFAIICTGLARSTWRRKHKRKKKENVPFFIVLSQTGLHELQFYVCSCTYACTAYA